MERSQVPWEAGRKPEASEGKREAGERKLRSSKRKRSEAELEAAERKPEAVERKLRSSKRKRSEEELEAAEGKREAVERKSGPSKRKRSVAAELKRLKAELAAELKRVKAELAERAATKHKLKRLESSQKSEAPEQKLEASERKLLEAPRKQSERAAASSSLLDRLSDVNGLFSLPKRDWLGQVLPSLRVEYESVSFSTHFRYEKFIPRCVKSWKSFGKEATDYKTETISGVPLIGYVKRIIAEKLVDSHSLAAHVMMYALDYLSLGPHGWTVVYKPESPISTGEGPGSTRVGTEATSANSIAQGFADTPKGVEPDIVVKKGEKAVLAVEINAPGVFVRNYDDDTNLVQSYCDVSGAKHRLHCECVHQIMSYMVNWNVKYGILSSAELTYFVRRVQDNDSHHSSVEISEAIRFDSKSPTLLEALFFILDKATIEVESGVNYLFKPASDLDSNEDAAEDDSLKRKAKKGRMKNISKTGTRKSPRTQTGKVSYRELKETAALNLQLERRPYPSRGWSGKIAIGFINGQRVAIKIARKYSEQAEALLREMTAYKMLQRYWGRYVPELVNYGTTSNGTLVFIATQFIDGSELYRRPLSEAECRAAEEALNGIHSSGLLHGDVHGANVMIVECGVRFIDFGFSRFITNEADCSKELNQLRRLLQQRILQENSTSTVTQS